MVITNFYLVVFIYVFLVTTKMAASQSGSGDDRMTSSSSTSASASSTTDCSTAISRASVCTTRTADDARRNDVVTTSQEGYDVTTTQHPVADDVTLGSSCELSTPRKSERDWMFRWAFSEGHSYLNLTLDEGSIVSGGYFVVFDSRCGEGLKWSLTVVSRNQRTRISILSREGNSPIDTATSFWFKLEKSFETKEVYVVFEGRQPDATKQQEQQGRQQGQPNNYCGIVVDVELLGPCEDAMAAEDISSRNTTEEHGASKTPSPKTPNQPISSSPAGSMGSTQSLRTTPLLTSKETPLIPSTESSPQNFHGSFRIRNQAFIPNLGQETTDEFKSLYSKIYPLLNSSYSLTCGSFYRGVHKISFRSGSIIVDHWFELIGDFDDQSRNRSSSIIVDEFGRNGWDVDPKSFEFEYYSGADKAKNGQTEDNNLLLIIVVSTVLGVLILVLVVIASLLIWRKTRRRDPEDEDETERQRAAQETRARDVISGMPRSQLMWQNMPSLKAGFDDQSLFVYELPLPSPAKAPLASTRKPPSASSLSFSSAASTSSSTFAPKNFLRYSHSESKHDPRFYIPRPRTMAESSHASFSGFSPRGLGQSPRGWGNSQHGGAEMSQVWGQLPLDYNSVTHDYFVGGPSTISVEPPEIKKNALRSQSTRPWSRTTKFSQRKSGSAPDAVDFGDVFLPSVPPFQLSDALRCCELPPEEVERSRKRTRRSTSFGCGRLESEESAVGGFNNDAFCEKSEQQSELEDRCGSDRCCSLSNGRMTSPPTLSPHASGSMANNQLNLLSAMYTKSSRRKHNSQAPDNIHRSTMITIADDAFFQVPGD